MQSAPAPQTGRLDRHIRRSYLRVDEGVSRHRISYSLEEALRLAVLPGEEEGRIYCFRRVVLGDITDVANRRVWTRNVERSLTALASQAIHASLPGATAADAIYFNNLEEALETLLSIALRATTAGPAKPAWFSTSLLGLEPGTGCNRQIPAIVERLRPPAFASGAAASIVFSALGDADPATFLSAIPTDTLREWLRAFDDEKTSMAEVTAVPLPRRLSTALERAASHFGWKDPSTIWLALQAILCVAPGTGATGTALKRARATLRSLEAEQRLAGPNRNASSIRDAQAASLVFDDDGQSSMQSRLSPLSSRPPLSQPNLTTPGKGQAFSPAPVENAMLVDWSVSATQPSVKTKASKPADARETPPQPAGREGRPETHSPLLGAVSQGAGLFFLLNALRRVGIVSALAACPALAEARFPAHILMLLAIHAGVADSDPILQCLQSSQEAFALEPEAIAALQLQREAWPDGFPPSSKIAFDSDYFLRTWAFAVKQWCRLTARLSVREIVNRVGRVWQTRTDIDITLPLPAADIRIRRIGLDIDPGWLPWFGVHGRVVRFHYRDREQGGYPC